MSRRRPASPPSLKLSITAQTGRAFVPFLRRYLTASHALLVAWASRPSAPAVGNRTKAAPRKRSGATPKPRTAAVGALGELSLVLVTDRRMSDLHARFMGIAGPTDVLSFPMETDPAGRVRSGEVIVCVPQARRQAKRRKLPVRLELLLYALHGMLHLLGYDDRTDRAFATMHSTEDAILTELGFGPVFAASASRKGGRR